jgi:hypothetical protein
VIQEKVYGFSHHIKFWKLLCINVTHLRMIMTMAGFHIKGQVHVKVNFTPEQAMKA